MASGPWTSCFEALTLIQTGRVRHFPVVLVGSGFWGGLADWMRERLVREGKLTAAELDLLTVCDEHGALVEAVADGARRQGIDIGG